MAEHYSNRRDLLHAQAGQSLPPEPPTLSDDDMTAEEKTIARLRAELDEELQHAAVMRLRYADACDTVAALRAEVAALRASRDAWQERQRALAARLEDALRVDGLLARSSAAGEDTK